MLTPQRTKALPLGFWRPRASSNPAIGGPQKASFPQLSSEFSCPSLVTIGSSKHGKLLTGSRVASTPFIRRKGAIAVSGRGQAHGYRKHTGANKLLTLGFVTTSRPRPPNSQTGSSELSCRRDIDDDTTSSSLTPSKRLMPKAPQLCFRSPSTAPKMVPLQTEFFLPSVKSPMSPQISFSTSTGSEYDYGPLSSAQTATVTAVLEPHRRSPPPENRPVLRVICSTDEEHILSVHLPGFAPEMVTVSARKEDKLAVVADLWHAEANCHHEWLVAFPSRDVNVSLTRAQLSADETLKIHVPRRNVNLYRARSGLR
ncbi:hypothetical protein DFH11DRAFT_1606427 [Phellopilus nigrolimitatus]|nr:hypothetical protein DFH11DRAFT_1606427 [Phellopilus nigrolimitatus]